MVVKDPVSYVAKTEMCSHTYSHAIYANINVYHINSSQLILPVTCIRIRVGTLTKKHSNPVAFTENYKARFWCLEQENKLQALLIVHFHRSY